MSAQEFDLNVHELAEVMESGDDLVAWLNIRFDSNNRYLAAKGVVGGEVVTISHAPGSQGRRLVFGFPKLAKSVFRLTLESPRKKASVQANYRFVDGVDKPYRFSFDWDDFVSALDADTVLRFTLHG